MELERDQIDRVRVQLLDAMADSYAPRPLLVSVAILIGEQPITAAIARRDREVGSQWECVVLTPEHIISASASREGDKDWALDSPTQDATQLQAVRWPRDQIQALEIEQVDDDSTGFGTSWDYRFRLVVRMEDGTRLSIPPFGGIPTNSYERKVAEELTTELLAR